MSIISRLLSKQWLGYLTFTVIFAVVCVALGQWQFARRAEAQTQIALLNHNYDSEPVALRELWTTMNEQDSSIKWTPVRVSGEYLTSQELFVRNRPLAGRIGFHQLVPFRTLDGLTLVIDRGWVDSNGDNSAPATTPPIPGGKITIVARLYPSEPTIAGRGAPVGQIATIHVPDIISHDSAVLDWYGQLSSEAPQGITGTLTEKPVLDEGPHLSYALQWYVFALMAFVALGWGIKRDIHGETGTPSARPRSRAARQDEDIEDALWDTTPTR